MAVPVLRRAGDVEASVSGPSPTMTLDEFRRQSRSFAEKRAEARRDFERYAQEEAEAERDYRKALAVAFARVKTDSTVTAAQADIEAHAQAAEERLRRDLARSLAKSALLRVEECEANRATLRSVGEWSQRIDATGAGVAA